MRGNIITDSGVDSMCRALTSNSQCVLQAILLSDGIDETKLSSDSLIGVSSLLEKTSSDCGRINILPVETRSILQTWIRLQEKVSKSSFLLKSNSTIQSKGVSSSRHNTGTGMSSELMSEDSTDHNLFEFDYVGPPG